MWEGMAKCYFQIFTDFFPSHEITISIHTKHKKQVNDFRINGNMLKP